MRSVLRAMLTCVAVVAIVGIAAPAVAATPSPKPTPKPIGQYVALGDSYAAGYGGGDESGRCAVSPNAYPDLLDGKLGIDLTENAACSGATTADVLSSQLGPLSKSTRLVTLSIGGNDLEAIKLATVCSEATVESVCGAALVRSLSLLAALPARLGSTYSAVAKAAPKAKIVVTGYSQLFYLPPSSTPADISRERSINAATEQLNDTIRKAVERAHKRGIAIRFVPVSLAGHGIGSANPWIIARGPMAFHPNAAGYRRYASTVTAALD